MRIFGLRVALSEGLEAYQDTPSYKMTIPQVCFLHNVPFYEDCSVFS